MQNKIVAISDAHLGQYGADAMGQFSLLSTRVEDNLVPNFAQAVEEFTGGDRVNLVVVGDFLDLSLSYMERVASLAADGLRVWGNHVPDSPVTAERLTRLRVQGGQIEPGLGVEAQAGGPTAGAIGILQGPDPAAAQLWHLLQRRSTIVGSAEIVRWIATHPTHPLARMVEEIDLVGQATW